MSLLFSSLFFPLDFLWVCLYLQFVAFSSMHMPCAQHGNSALWTLSSNIPKLFHSGTAEMWGHSMVYKNGSAIILFSNKNLTWLPGKKKKLWNLMVIHNPKNVQNWVSEIICIEVKGKSLCGFCIELTESVLDQKEQKGKIWLFCMAWYMQILDGQAWVP